MLDWNNQPIRTPVEIESVNPCVRLYGAGLVDTTCKDCVHLRYRVGPDVNPNARHWKCDLRKVTNGPATDHKVRWPSCARYEKRTEEYHGG